MYRVNKSYDQSSSDEEGPSICKEQRLDLADDDMKGCKAGSEAAQMWANLLAEQSLAETFSGKVGVYRGEDDVVERGVESYTLPDERYTNNDQEIKHYANQKVLSAADDSGPFDFIADEDKFETFSDKYGRNKQRAVSFGDQKRNSKQSWKHFASTSHSNRKRRNNFDPNIKKGNRIAENVGNADIALNHRRGELNSSSLPSNDYSLKRLLTAEFPENISISELADRIVRALGERNENFLRSVILEIGKDKAIELFEATRGIEASGGMMIADGTRRRTPGGIFMTLFKTDADILPVLKEKLCNMQKAVAREIRIAKRKGKREAAKASVDGRVEMLKLSTSSQVFLGDESMKEGPLQHDE